MFSNKKNIFLAFVLFLLLSISIGYASFSYARKNVNVNASVNKEFDVRIVDVKYKIDGAPKVEKPTISNLKVNFNTTLNNDIDQVVYTIKIKNFGISSAKINNIIFSEDDNEIIKPMILVAPTSQDTLKPHKTTIVKIIVKHNPNVEFKASTKIFSSKIEYTKIDK